MSKSTGILLLAILLQLTCQQLFGDYKKSGACEKILLDYLADYDYDNSLKVDFKIISCEKTTGFGQSTY